MAGEVCPDCGKRYMRNYRDADTCDRIRVSSYCANNTIVRLRHQLKAAEAGLHRAWGEGYERAMNDRDEPNWTETPETPNPYPDPEVK